MPDKADKTITVEFDDVADVAFSPDQTRLYASLTTGDIDVFDVATQQKVATWHIGGALSAVSVSPDGSYLLAADPRQPLVYRVNTNTGDILRTYLGTGAAYRDVEIVDANTAVLTAPGFLKPAVTLNLDTGVTQPLDRSAYYSGSSILTRDVNLTLFGETGISNGPLALYDVRSNSIVATGDDYQSPYTGFNYGSQAVSEAAGKVFQFIYSGTINVYDLSLKYERSVNIGQSIAGMAFDPTGKYVYAYLAEGAVAKYDISTFNRVDLVSAAPTTISSASQNYGNALLAADDGRHLVVTNYNMSYSDPGGSTQIIDLTGRSKTLIGTQGNDTLIGSVGNDIVIASRGADQIDGSAGTDALIFAGLAHGYVFSVKAGAGTVSGGIEGTSSTVSSIETLSFADGVITFDENSAAAQVYRLYDTAFSRAPDYFGGQYWTDVVSGGRSLSSIADEFASSAEFQSRIAGMTNSQIVDYVYQSALHRAPDAGGSAYWTYYLDSGHSLGEMLRGFSESAEHKANTAGAVQAGLWDGESAYETVEFMYDAAFGRRPDQGGLGYWASAIESGATSHDLAELFTHSDEYRNNTSGMTNGQLVEYTYQTALHRSADPGGMAYWTHYLDSGGSTADLISLFAGSSELMNNNIQYIDHGVVYV